MPRPAERRPDVREGEAKSRTVRNVLAAMALVIACGAAFWQGRHATRDLPWPGDPDFARDIASAEAIASRHPLADPFYRGEWAWYNPLAPSLVAGIAVTTGSPIPVVYARAGAWLNLAAPIAIFCLAACWWGRFAAVATLIAFLFLIPGDAPAWIAATYSPWLLPMHVGQAFCYAGLLAIAAAFGRGTTARFALAGVAIGVTFLTHAAPALILAGAMGIETIRRVWIASGPERRQQLARTLVAGMAALIVAAPFLVSIVWHYRLNVRNPAPMAFVLPGLEAEQTWTFVRQYLPPTAHGLVAAAGFVLLVRRRHELHARLLLAATLTSVALFVQSEVAQSAWATAMGVRSIVPGHHFVYYLRAFEALAFGVGLQGIARWLAAVLPESLGAGRPRVAMTGLLTVVAATAIWQYPSYARLPDFVYERRVAERNFADADLRAMYDWLRRDTSPGDVVLAPLNTGQYVVGVAGRKVVAVDKLFSNPYVDWGERARDRDELDALFTRGDWTSFLNLAAKYRVRFVVRRGALPQTVERPEFVSEAWRAGEWVVYRVGK